MFRDAKLLLSNLAKRTKGKPRADAGVSPLSVIQDVMVEYLESQRQFIMAAETCSRRGWPDQGASLYLTWKLQKLFVQRQELRFEYLLARGGLGAGAWSSLSSITDRLDRNWSEDDERGAVAMVHGYNDLTIEIAETVKSRTSMDPDLLDGPLRTVQKQAEYRAARQAINEKVHELEKRLSMTTRKP